MKQLLFALCFVVLAPAAFAQKYIPTIKAGSVLNYNIYMKNMGQNVELDLTINALTDPIKMQWNVPGYGTGSFEMPLKSLENGKKTVLSPPEPDGVTKVSSDETLMVLSKALFSDATKNQAFELNGIKFTVITDTATYKINNKTTDIVHAVSADNKSGIWILNNPDYPIICQGVNITKGIDFYLTSIK
ncbi:MAG TPA: hypothetical protein VGC01_06470 [Mucilaginibacter sp.]